MKNITQSEPVTFLTKFVSCLEFTRQEILLDEAKKSPLHQTKEIITHDFQIQE